MRVNNVGVVLVLLFVFFTLFIGASMRENADEDFNIYNITNSINISMGCDEIFARQANLTNGEFIDINEIKSERIKRMTCVFTQAVITLSIDGSLFMIEYGYEHPENDYESMYIILRMLIWLLIISALTPLLIPAIALIYLAIVGIIKLVKYIDEYIKQSKEKKK